MKLEGSVDTWWPELTGWVRSPEQPLAVLSLTIEVNGEVVGRAVTRHGRPDVDASGTPGFSVPLARLMAGNEPHLIRLIEQSSGAVVFDSPTLRGFQDFRMSHASVAPSWSLAVGDLDALKTWMQDSGRLAILAAHHGDRLSVWPASTLAEAMIDAGYPTLVVDTSATPLSSIADGGCVIGRSNVGWDFGSWATGLLLAGEAIGCLDRLVLCNDSCFGPFGGIVESLRHMNDLDSSFVGLTDGRFGGPHVQSYFMEFRGVVLSSGALERFLATYTFPDDKVAAVREGELALTRFLDALGHEFRVVHPYEEVVQRMIERDFMTGHESSGGKAFREGRPVNTTYAAWDVLLDEGFPFVKRNIFSSMGQLVDDVEKVRQMLFKLVPSRFADQLLAEISVDHRQQGT